MVLDQRRRRAADPHRRRLQRRRHERRDDAGGHRRRLPHPPVRHRVHAEGPGLPPLLRLPEPLLLRHARPHHGRQHGRPLRGVGGRRPLQLPPHRLLVHRGEERQRRQEGLHRQPHRRLRPPPRYGDARLPVRHAALGGPGDERAPPPRSGQDLADRQPLGRDAARLPRAVDHPRAARPGLRLHPGRPRHLPRLRRQERADPALHLAPRRHGGPDPGLRAHPRGHDGHGRRLPRGAHLVHLRPLAGGHGHRGDGGRAHGDLRRLHRTLPDRPEEGARLLHREPARLHVHRRRRGRLLGGLVPRLHARLLQGLPLPRRRLGHPRHARAHPRHRSLAGHAQHGRPRALPADHPVDVPALDARHRRRPALRGLLVQGRDPLEGLLGPRHHQPLRRPAGDVDVARLARPGDLLGRHRRRDDDRVLHVPRLLHDLPRQVPRLEARRRLARRPRPRRRPPRGRRPARGPRAARVAPRDDGAADHPRRVRRRGRLPRSGLGSTRARTR